MVRRSLGLIDRIGDALNEQRSTPETVKGKRKMMGILARGLRYVGARAAVLAVPLVFGLGALNVTSGQTTIRLEKFPRGQNIAPVFEGWEENSDGTVNMLFGYFNRNWEEQPDIPIGPNNTIEPGGPDQGQPTHFFPRRNKFMFRVSVPKDFGDKELVWTLVVNGKTERAYATVKPDYKIDGLILQTNTHMHTVAFGMEANQPPVVELGGSANRTVRVGEPLSLSASIIDDGLLKPMRARLSAPRSDATALGLRVAWYVYRGAVGTVTFEPEQFKIYQEKQPEGNSPFTPLWAPPPLPLDGKFPVKVTFSAPGTFVLRVSANDGGFETTRNVTVTVK